MRAGWRWAVRGASLCVAGAAFVLVGGPPLRTATGLTAHNLCAATFTSGLDPRATFLELVKPMSSVAGPFLSYRVDRAARTVDASALGLFRAHAAFTQGYGCRLIYPGGGPSPPPRFASPPSPPDGFAPATPVSAAAPALKAALDAVFADPKLYAKAVVVVKDGKVVAERYAPGFGVATPVLSYSVAKSFTNALLAVLVRQGRLKMDAPAPVPEWRAPGDPRGRITLDDLLRMQSGLDAAETGSGFDPASQMVYAHDDMAGYAAGHRLRKAPGAEWAYTSANTLIVDRAIGQAVGGGAPGLRRFADAELFGPLHMDGVTLEFDGVGVFSGSAHVYAPARDFARLGVLYLNDGVAPDGRRILPPGWVAYSRRSTLGTSYGSGFWTNDGPSEGAAWRIAHGLPKDGFFASGNRGQRIYIVPSERLVMARFGYSPGPTFGMPGDMTVLSAAIAAFKAR